MKISGILLTCGLLLMAGVTNAQDKIFPVAQQMPAVKGCEEMGDMQERHSCTQDKIKAFVTENLKYPDAAAKAGKDGYVMVSFVVTSKGTLTDIAVDEDPGYGMGDAALKVVKKMNKLWVPGKNKGEAVSVSMKVPVLFKLPENEATGEISEPDVYFVVDDMPRFEGCDEVSSKEARSCTFQNLTKFVMAHMKYPEKAKEAGIEGTVIAQVIIAQDGTLQNASIVEGLGYGCDEEALRVLSEMPNWSPGKQDGKAVKVQMQLPFRFRAGK